LRAAWDPQRDMIVLSGAGGNAESTQHITWGLHLSQQLSADPAVTVAEWLTLGAAHPVPASATVSFVVGAAATSGVSAAVFDVAGRRVRTLWNRILPSPSARVATWDLRDDAGRAVAPGLYLVRVWTDREVRARRVVVTR